jgi:hypothetical protein
VIKFGVLIFALVISQFQSSAQEIKNKADSIRKIISITPYLELDQNTASQFAVQVIDTSAIQLSSGINVINSLRGRVPNLSVPSYVASFKAGIRDYNYNASIILDGIPFYNTLSNFVSLNGFDYASISVVSNTNSLIELDGLEDGTIILQSKTAKGFTKPSFELNSYTTYGYNEVSYLDYLSGSVLKTKQEDWLFANSIAYMQDFGKLDTRLSYSFNSKQSQFSTIGEPMNHNIKLNTGIQASQKLSFRILLDNSSINDENTIASANLNNTLNIKLNQNFLNGNLSMVYFLNNYIRVSSQLNMTTVYDKSSLKNGQNFETQSKNNTRYLSNIFLNFTKRTNLFNVSAKTGIQYTNHINASTLKSNINNSEYESVINSLNIVVGSQLGFKDIVFVNGQYRLSEYSSLPSSDNLKFNYSAGFAFIFSKLIHSKMLSMGKIRATSGRTTPWAFNNFPSFVSNGNTSLKPESIVNSEIGLDLNFFNSRATLSTNYFIYRSENKTGFGGFSNPSGFAATYINLGNLTHSGIEFSIGYKPIVSKTINYEMMLIYSTLNAVVTIDGAGNVNPTSPALLPSSFPDWRGSIYNQVNGKKLGLSFLVDGVQGGQYFTFNPGNNPLPVDGSFIKLRDISLRYQFTDLAISKLNLSKLWFSVSFRNSIIYTIDDFDSEGTSNPIQKSISGNLYVSF